MKNGLLCAIGLGGQSVFLSVDHFHAPGETLHADHLYTEPGGKAYNQIVAASRLGTRSLFVGAVGKDENAAICRDFLRREGVACELMESEQSGTAYACILTDAAGDNRVTVYRGAADELSAEFIRSKRALLEQCTMFLFGLECPLEATLAALEIAKATGAYTILNPAPARKLELSLLRRFDLITPNAQEICELLNVSDAVPRELCAALREAGLDRAVVTLGSEGALLWENGCARLFPAIRRRTLDTTGAGDCFNAALASALTKGKALVQAVEFAVNASALSVTKAHVMGSLPTLDEVLENYKKLAPEIIEL